MKKRQWILPLFFVVFLNLVSGLTAEEGEESSTTTVQSGEIGFEDTKEVKINLYTVSQEKAADWVNTVYKQIETAQPSADNTIDDDIALYLAATYLYCTTKIGDCTYILDTILNTDIQKNVAACPNTTKFWKVWLNNDLEERLKYLTPIAGIKRIAAFNTEQRPKYIKCKDTVSKIISDKEGLKIRFSKDSEATNSAKQFVDLIEEIKTKNIDIYSSVEIKIEKAQKNGK